MAARRFKSALFDRERKRMEQMGNEQITPINVSLRDMMGNEENYRKL